MKPSLLRLGRWWNLAEEISHGGKPTLQKTATALKRLGG